MGALLVENSHMFHKVAHNILRAVLQQSQGAVPRRKGRRQPAVPSDEAGTWWRLPVKQSNFTNAVLHYTHQCCKGCNSIAHRRIRSFFETLNAILGQFETKDECIVAFLIAEVVHLFQLMKQTNGVDKSASFRARSLVSFYACAAMFVMYIDGVELLDTTEFLYFYQFFFVEVHLLFLFFSFFDFYWLTTS